MKLVSPVNYKDKVTGMLWEKCEEWYVSLVSCFPLWFLLCSAWGITGEFEKSRESEACWPHWATETEQNKTNQNLLLPNFSLHEKCKPVFCLNYYWFLLLLWILAEKSHSWESLSSHLGSYLFSTHPAKPLTHLKIQLNTTPFIIRYSGLKLTLISTQSLLPYPTTYFASEYLNIWAYNYFQACLLNIEKYYYFWYLFYQEFANFLCKGARE